MERFRPQFSRFGGPKTGQPGLLCYMLAARSYDLGAAVEQRRARKVDPGDLSGLFLRALVGPLSNGWILHATRGRHPNTSATAANCVRGSFPMHGRRGPSAPIGGGIRYDCRWGSRYVAGGPRKTATSGSASYRDLNRQGPRPSPDNAEAADCLQITPAGTLRQTLRKNSFADSSENQHPRSSQCL